MKIRTTPPAVRDAEWRCRPHRRRRKIPLPNRASRSELHPRLITGFRRHPAETPHTSFVSRLHFRSAAVVFHRLRHLADHCTRFLPAIEGSGLVIHDSGVTPVEGGLVQQFGDARLRDPHVRQFYYHDHSGHHNGGEVWKEPARRLLLPCCRELSFRRCWFYFGCSQVFSDNCATASRMKKQLNKAVGRNNIRCPKCGSTNVRRQILRRINIGCVLVNALTSRFAGEALAICPKVPGLRPSVRQLGHNAYSGGIWKSGGGPAQSRTLARGAGAENCANVWTGWLQHGALR